DPQVRLAVLLALAEMPEEEHVPHALGMILKNPQNLTDRWIPDAFTVAAAKNALGFLKETGRTGAALSQRACDIVGIVAEHYARGGPSNTVGNLLVDMATGNANQVEVILAGLARGWPKDKSAELSEETEKAMAKLFEHASAGAKGQLVRL